MPHPKDPSRPPGENPSSGTQGAPSRPGGQPASEGATGPAKGGALARELEDEGRAGKGENQAGFLKEKDGEAGRNT